MKYCSKYKKGKCLSILNPQFKSEFNKDRRRVDKLAPQCKTCLKQYRKSNQSKILDAVNKWRTLNPDKVKAYQSKHNKNNFKYLYNITIEERERILISQNGKCAICQGKDSNRSLCIDHCHSSGKIRGLLCTKCNLGIGLFYDNIDHMKSAIEYILNNN